MIDIPTATIEELRSLDHSPGSEIIQQLVSGTANRIAALPAQLGENLEYLHIHRPKKPHPAQYQQQPRNLLIVPGFNGGVLSGLPFGVAMADRGHDSIVTGQNRAGTPRIRDAARLQARNMMAVIEDSGLQDSRVDIAAHSFGSLVAEEKVRSATKYQWTCFEQSSVVMLAPMGIDHQRGYRYYPDLARRFGVELFEQMNIPVRYPDIGSTALRVGIATFMENPLRASAEVLRILGPRIDIEELSGSVGRVAWVGFSFDNIASAKLLVPAFNKMKDEFTFTINSNDEYPVLHNDLQFNPERVADVVSFILDTSTNDMTIGTL